MAKLALITGITGQNAGFLAKLLLEKGYELEVYACLSEVEAPKETWSSSWPTLAELEREHIRRTLNETGHNQSMAARMLNISRQQLVRKIARLGLEVPPRRRGRPREAHG